MTLLIKSADVILSRDDERRELLGYDILVENGEITRIDKDIPLPQAGEVAYATGSVVTPGLVNTHHHLYQTLTRAVPWAGRFALWLAKDFIPHLGEIYA